MKKLTATFIALAVLLSTGCAKKTGSSGTSDTASPTAVVVQTIYKESEISLNGDMGSCVSLQKFADGYYYFYTDNDSYLKYVTLDNDFNVSQPVTLEKSIGCGYCIYVHDDGGFTVLAPGTDFELKYDDYGNISNYAEFQQNAKIYFTLTDYNNSGNIVNQYDVTGMDEYFDLRRSNLFGMMPYDDDTYIVSLGNGAVLMDTSGNVTNGQIYDQQIAYFGMDTDGRMLLSVNCTFCYMDKNGSLDLPEDIQNFDEYLHLKNNAKTGDMGFKAFFSADEGIFGVTDKGELVLVVDYKTSMVESADVQDFVAVGDGLFLTAGYDCDSLKLYTRRPDDYKEDRQTVNVWQIYSGGSDDMAVRFNKQNDDYLVKYALDLKHLDDLSKAVLTGDSPDLIYYSNRTVLDGMINLGAASDLYPLMENYDGVKPDDLMPNVLEALDMDGKLYAIPENFCVSTMYANSDVIGDKYRNWTFEDMYDLADKRPDDMSLLLESYNDGIEERLLLSYQSPWVDAENHTCNYDSDRFIEYLEFTKNVRNPMLMHIYDRDIERAKIRSTSMADKKAMICEDTGIRYGYNFYLSSLGQHGLPVENATLLNYPDSGETGLITCDNCYTVLNTGNCPEGAWAFVSYLLSDEVQLKWANQNPGWNLTNKKAFDKSLENCITQNGEPKMNKMQHNFENNVTFEQEYPVTSTAEQVEKYREFVLNCTELEYYNDDIRTILYDEYNRYLNDEITAKECAQTIQDRVEILLSEQAE